jgi:hypothetical protein
MHLEEVTEIEARVVRSFILETQGGVQGFSPRAISIKER